MGTEKGKIWKFAKVRTSRYISVFSIPLTILENSLGCSLKALSPPTFQFVQLIDEEHHRTRLQYPIMLRVYPTLKHILRN